MGKPIIKVIQPSFILDKLGVKDKAEGEKIISTILDFLIYMSPGDVLETSMAKYHKIQPDLVQLEVFLDPKLVVDSLEKKRIIKFPL